MVISFLRVWWGKCRLAGKDTRATWAARTDRRCWRFHNAWRLGKVHDGTSVGVSGMNGISLPSEFQFNHAPLFGLELLKQESRCTIKKSSVKIADAAPLRVASLNHPNADVR